MTAPYFYVISLASNKQYNTRALREPSIYMITVLCKVLTSLRRHAKISKVYIAWVWRSLVACLNGVQEAGSSNLLTQTRESPETLGFRAFYFLYLYSAKMYDKALLITVFVDFRKNFI